MSIAFNVAFYCDISKAESLSHTKCCLYHNNNNHKRNYAIKSWRREIIIIRYDKIGLHFIKEFINEIIEYVTKLNQPSNNSYD